MTFLQNKIPTFSKNGGTKHKHNVLLYLKNLKLENQNKNVYWARKVLIECKLSMYATRLN